MSIPFVPPSAPLPLPISVANGGTGVSTTPPAGGVAYGTGSGLAYTAEGTSGYFLKSNGASEPTWVAGTSESHQYALDYWIDPQNGSDSNTGTSIEEPWQTLTYAANNIEVEGANIWLMSGVYAEAPLELEFSYTSLFAIGNDAQSVVLEIDLTINNFSGATNFTGICFFNPVTITASSNVYFNNCNIEAGSGGYLALSGAANVTFNDCDWSQAEYVSMTTGKAYFNNCLINGFNMTDAGICYMNSCPTITYPQASAGLLYINSSTMWATTPAGYSISTTGSSVVILTNVISVDSNNALTKVAIEGASYSIMGLVAENFEITSASNISNNMWFDTINTFHPINTLSGGTGNTGIPTPGGVAYGISSGIDNKIGVTGAGTSGQVLVSGGAGEPTWQTLSSDAVTSFSAGTTGLTPNTATEGAVVLGGTLAIGSGGTNATATPTAGAVPYGTGTAYAFTAAGTSGQVLKSNGAGEPTWEASGLAAHQYTSDYWIDPVNGNDSNSGTSIEDPWKTFTNAANTLAYPDYTGYNIWLMGGTYSESALTINLAGASIYAVGGKAGSVTFEIPLTIDSSSGVVLFNGVSFVDEVIVESSAVGIYFSDCVWQSTNTLAMSGSLVFLNDCDLSLATSVGMTTGTTTFNHCLVNGFDLTGAGTCNFRNCPSIVYPQASAGMLNIESSTLYGTVEFGDSMKTTGTSGVTFVNVISYDSVGNITDVNVDGSGGFSAMALQAANFELPVSTDNSRPAWFDTIHIFNPLGTLSGGTGNTSIPTPGGVAYGINSGLTNEIGTTGAGTSGQVLTSAGASEPTWTTLSGVAVTSFSAGTTGLTPSSPTEGAVVLGGTLAIASGGTNATATPTAGGVPYGTGTAYAFTAAGTSGYYLTSGGAGAPTWSASGLTAHQYTTDYWIDPVNGNNSNSGLSIENPWKTLTHALATVSSGVNIWLMAGTYTEGSPITCTTGDLNIFAQGTGTSQTANLDIPSITFNNEAGTIYISNVTFAGDLYVTDSAGCTVDGCFFVSVTVENTGGELILNNCSGQFLNTFINEGLLVINNSTILGPTTQSGGTTNIFNSNVYHPICTDGILTIDSSSTFSTTVGGYSVSTSSTGELTMQNVTCYDEFTSSYGVIDVVGIIYSFSNVIYEPTGSTISGTNQNLPFYFDNLTLINPLRYTSGGTGTASVPTAGGAVYGTGTTMATTAAGSAGQVLTSNGSSAPTWQNAPFDFIGNKNRLINGAFNINQYWGTSSTTPGGNFYINDRWLWNYSGTNFLVAFQTKSDTPPVGFQNYYRATSQNTATINAGDYYFMAQRIQGNNCYDFEFGNSNAQTVTVSFWARSSIAQTYSISVQNSGQSRSYVANYAIGAANVWQYVTIVVPGDTSGTWLSGGGTTIGLQLTMCYGAGTTYQGTANTWTGSNILATSATGNLFTVNGATLDFAGVQIEVGSVATGFDYQNYQKEFQVCQTYFTGYYALPGNSTFTLNTSTGATGLYYQWPNTMIANPSSTGLSVSSVSTQAFGNTSSSTSITMNLGVGSTAYGAYLTCTNPSDFSGLGAIVCGSSTTGITLTAQAEL